MTTTDATLDLGFSIDGVASPLRAVALEGREAISELFAFHVTVTLDDEHAHLGDVLGRKAKLQMDVGTRARTIHGVVSRVEEDDDAGGPIAAYRVTLQPSAYLLCLRLDCRIFQDRTAPEDHRGALLRAAGFAEGEYRSSFLHGAYRRREQCVQYRETDWSFLMRLLESEGIFRFFEQGDDDQDRLVFADTPFAHPRIAEPSSIPYRRASGALAAGEHVQRFRVAEALRPGRVELRGHSFLEPSCSGWRAWRAGAPSPSTTRRPRSPRPRSATSSPASGWSRRTSRAARRTARASAPPCAPVTSSASRRSGRVRALNRDWLATSAEHHATVPAKGTGAPPSYRSRASRPSPLDVVAAPALQSCRRRARWCEASRRPWWSARPAKGTIHTDALGRVKVQFHWDRRGPRRREQLLLGPREGLGLGGPRVRRALHAARRPAGAGGLRRR